MDFMSKTTCGRNSGGHTTEALIFVANLPYWRCRNKISSVNPYELLIRRVQACIRADEQYILLGILLIPCSHTQHYNSAPFR